MAAPAIAPLLMYLLNMIGAAGTVGYLGSTFFGSYGDRAAVDQAEKEAALNRQVAALTTGASMRRAETAGRLREQDMSRADRQAFLDRELMARLSRDQSMSGLLGNMQDEGIRGVPEAMAGAGDEAAAVRRQIALSNMQSSNDPFIRMFGG